MMGPYPPRRGRWQAGNRSLRELPPPQDVGTATPRRPWYPIRYRRLKPGCAQTSRSFLEEISHDHTHSPHRTDRCRGRRCRHAGARSAIARTGRGAARRPAGRRAGTATRSADIEVTVATDGVNRFKFPDGFVTNHGRDQINAALAAAYLQTGARHDRDPVLPLRGQHRLKAGRDRHRHRRGELQEQQGRRRAIPHQPEGVRHRPQSGRRRRSSPISTATTSTDCSRPTASPRSRMPRSWCRRRSGNTSWTTAR